MTHEEVMALSTVLSEEDKALCVKYAKKANLTPEQLAYVYSVTAGRNIVTELASLAYGLD